jgi:ribosomal protein S18 acetylase RimI-like enzyme
LIEGRLNSEHKFYCVVGNTKEIKLYDSLGFREVYTIEYAVKNIAKGI